MNKYQTQLTDELLNDLPDEIREELLDTLQNVEFIRRLVAPDRKYAKDLERRNGRIIVDIINPHILEDMEYFRPTGNHYRKYGTLTNLRPNGNPNSEFGKWLATEVDRIWYGMVRESDGEWVTGDMYFYLNYTPIIQSKIREGTKQADRVVDFPEVWEGVYLMFHYIDQARNGGLYNNWEGGQHAVEIAKRGASKSYLVASLLAKIFVVGENKLAWKNTRGVVTAYQKESLVKDGTLNKYIDIIDFCAENTQFPAQRLKDSLVEMTWEMGYKDLDTGAKKGTGNVTLGVTAKDNVEKSRGKRSNKFIYEEFGAFKKFIDIWNVNLPSVQEGDIVFGQAIAIGTGGSEGSDFYGALEIIYNPIGYYVYALPNVFDKNSQGQKHTVFFFGTYMNRKGCYNKDGVSDVVASLLQVFKGRYKLKYNSTDPMALTRNKAENPITIQEAIMRRDTAFYPSADILDQIQEIDNNPRNLDSIAIGELEMGNSNEIRFKPSLENMPIREFPHKDNKMFGCVEVHVPPSRTSSGKVQRGRYVAGIDTFDDDESQTLSLGSIYILDLLTDDIVFEYTGRRMFADDFYEICRRALLWYNAEANYENNKKGLFGYFSKLNCTYLLSDTLEFLKDKEMIKGSSYGNKAHPYTQNVMTPDGLKLWKDIQIGDSLFNSYGGITKVIDIPFDNNTDIYNVYLKDGRVVQASLNHLWEVIDWNGYKKILTTEQILTDIGRNKGKYFEYKYYIPNHDGVKFDKQTVKLDAYLLGLMLGDGGFTGTTKNQLSFTSSIADLNIYKQYINYQIKTKDDRHHSIVIPNVIEVIKEYNLLDKKSHTKFIPNIYKYNSKEVRLNLIQGLFDTDGHIGYGGNPEYVTVSKQLADDVVEVLRSLGINCNMNTRNNSYGEYYKVRCYTDIPLFKLERKYSKQKLTKNRHKQTAIVDIKYSHNEMAKCVTVDSEDSCYLIGDYVKTHNSKGTISTAPIKAYGRKIQRDWLLKPVIKVVEQDGEMVEVRIPKLKTIKSRAYLKELSQWNPDGNFDRHDAVLMLMLIREDKLRLFGENPATAVLASRDTNYLGDDKFFSKNYDDRISKNRQIPE